ncbi:DMT family transporter [Nocardioides bruguierae]|uniref:DMT family transporter n=1 Tax=Nocardioides bruguierae TaxID=2945102 RepID=UPI0020227AB6|nr:DMT family transporter [Nocardioides bruguierae]MCL8027640.1 DMT family transporter [Nocardioides bruguierae]
MNAPAPGSPTGLPWLPLAAVATTLVLWASAFVAIRYLHEDFSPGALTLGRLVVASVCLAVVALLTARRSLRRPTGREWAGMAVIGVLWFALYSVALNEGESRVDAGTASMLIQVSPVLISVLAAIFLGERFTRWLGLGLAVAFAGVVVISLSTSDAADRDSTGVLLCLVAAVAYSISLVVQKPLVARLPAIQVTWLAATIGCVVSLPFAPQLVREVAAAPPSSTFWMVYMGALPTALAFTTYAYALRHLSASTLGVTTYLVPPLTIVMGWLLLAETPPALAYAGGALALVGVALTRRGGRARAARARPEEPVSAQT